MYARALDGKSWRHESTKKTIALALRMTTIDRNRLERGIRWGPSGEWIVSTSASRCVRFSLVLPLLGGQRLVGLSAERASCGNAEWRGSMVNYYPICLCRCCGGGVGRALTLGQLCTATGRLAQDGRAARADDDTLCVTEDGGDLVAAGALHVHEVRVRVLHQALQLVLPLLLGGQRVQQVLGELHGA